MIPKIIHYCWFGRQSLPAKVIKYMDSWRKYLPDFEIKEWNEDNFDVNMFAYTKEAYFAKKYAFVSDVARLWALVNEGGLYLDTDILVLKPFDPNFWTKRAFIGFEHDHFIGTGLIAAGRNHPFFKEFLYKYKDLHFFHGPKYDEETNVSRITKFFLQKGLVSDNSNQVLADVNIYQQEYFCNKIWSSNQYYNSGISYTIHDFQSSWTTSKRNIYEKVLSRIMMLQTILRYKIVNRMRILK